MLSFAFDVELNTEQPFIVELNMNPNHTETLSGAISLKLDRPEVFKVATIAIHGHLGAMVKIETPNQNLVRNTLVEATVDLIAANDTDGRGTIRLEEGQQYIPFRIDLPRTGTLPPTLINKLDTPYIDWKYEIHATLRRDYFFSTTRVVKHDLILRRPIAPPQALLEPAAAVEEAGVTVSSTESVHHHLSRLLGIKSSSEGEAKAEAEEGVVAASIDRAGEYRSKIKVPGTMILGQDRLKATVELKARNKAFVIKEVDCAIVQTEDIDYDTRRGGAPIEEEGESETVCKVNATRLVSSHVVLTNDEGDMDFGRFEPLEFDLRVDNDQLIPTEYGLGWLQVSHVLRYTIHFMDVAHRSVMTSIPLFVGHGVVSTVNPEGQSSRLVGNLKIAGAEDHYLHSEREVTPEPEQ
ncbi:hypothetical protein EMPS_09566 [Entomortierella parvispora]|uniref:Uncharacterized protein n=1 Tax=Entomortierella parvispora TaxID=205924 RepID=A0A9P3HJ28_9FUNG|nr:hypothetical protein EMPS_09566 [Entomortierella parvispora]